MQINNNAAAVLLVLETFAKDREVIVSRGQLVEIGGSYRLPDVMAASGAILREVGTTSAVMRVGHGRRDRPADPGVLQGGTQAPWAEGGDHARAPSQVALGLPEATLRRMFAAFLVLVVLRMLSRTRAPRPAARA